MNALDCMGVCLALGPGAPTLAPLLDFSDDQFARNLFDNIDGCAVWSDGCGMVAVRGEAVAQSTMDMRSAWAFMVGDLWTIGADAIEALVPKLAPVPGPGFCDKCNGAGRVDCKNCGGDGGHYCHECDDDHDCGKCGGDGSVQCSVCYPAPVQMYPPQVAIKLDIGGEVRLIDARRLRHLMLVLSDPFLSVAWVKIGRGGRQDALYIESHGGGRRGLLMPLLFGPDSAPTIIAAVRS